MRALQQARGRRDRLSASLSERVCALSQSVFEAMGYPSWQELSAHEVKARRKEYHEVIGDAWARLKRAHPEAESAACVADGRWQMLAAGRWPMANGCWPMAAG